MQSVRSLLAWARTSAMALALSALSQIVAPPLARGQSPEMRGAVAETLFQDAKRLMASGDYASACPKLDESMRLDPGNGTRLALALCYEGEGKTAAAWSLFTLGAAAARQENRADRETLAREHVASLEPRLCRLTIVVDPSAVRVPGLEIRQDGVVLAGAVWGAAIPVDPGVHTIEASAPGKSGWRTTVMIEPRGDRKSVLVPLLGDEPGERSPSLIAGAAPSGEPSSRGGVRRAIGFVVGGIGVVALGSFAYFAASGSSEYRDLQRSCGPRCDSQEVDPVRAKLLAADISLAVGVAALGSAAFLIFWRGSAPSSSAAQPLRLAAQPAAHGAVGSIVGRF
jgi:hypothetical protein